MKQNLKFIKLRSDSGLSQFEFAAKIGVSRSTIADIERGRIGISKRVLSKLVEKMDVESGYFVEKETDHTVNLNRGIESGVTQGSQQKLSDFLTDLSNKMSSGFPADYFGESNFYLNQNFEKKLLKDIIQNHIKVNELSEYLTTIRNFEFLINNLNQHYFNKVDLQFHSAAKYLENGKFNYDVFKADYIKELEKLDTIRPALKRISKAIESFYNEIKEFDTENIISGYFGEDQQQ